MGDRSGSHSRVRISEDKVYRKDWCWSVGTDYILEKLPDVSESGLVEAGRYIMVSELTLAVSRARVSMEHALALDARMWPREDVPGLELIDEDVDLLRG